MEKELHTKCYVDRKTSRTERPLQRPTCRWLDNIKMNLKDLGSEGERWIQPDHDRD
jgi:hypothetical protein